VDENLSGGVAPDEGGESGSTENPWGSWEQAGVDPSLNPYEVRQYMDWVQDLTGAETHERALEQAMQQWGHLQEGESLADIMAIRDQLRSERENPFEQFSPSPEEFHPEQELYAEPPQASAQDNYIDPNQLREVWQQDMASQLQQEREAMAQEMEAERIVNDLHGQLDKLADREGLEDQDKQLVWNLAVQQITAQDLEPGDLPGIMDNTWNQMNDLYARKYAKAAGQTKSAPATTSSASAPAAPGQPEKGGLEAAMRRTAELMGMDPNDV